VKSQGQAMICPACDGLCASAAEREASEAKARMRARPLGEELGTVFSYPLSDKVAFVLLAVFVGVFSVAASFAAFGAGLAILLSQGLLYAYAFTAINRVSSGNLGSFMPNVGDITDLIEPMRVGLAALLISTGPLLMLAFMHPPQEVLGAMGIAAPAALTGEPAPTPEPTLPPELQGLVETPPPEDLASEDELGAEEEGEGGDASGEGAAAGEESAAAGAPDFEAAGVEEPGTPAWVFAAYVAAIAWKVLYSPVALVAAAISRGFFATLNPLAGIGAILRMGGIYWFAMGIYTLIVAVETLLVGALGMIPLAGRFLSAFVQSYTYLAIGCLLGLAVFKKAPELGLD
jgi:hypothetical protein